MECECKKPTKVMFEIPQGRFVRHDLMTIVKLFEKSTSLRHVGEITGLTTVVTFSQLNGGGKLAELPALLVERIQQGQVTMLEQLKSKGVTVKLA